MRISDWSSDVCSSDLEVERLCEIDVARLVIRRRGVRDVRREHHHALAAQLERRRMQAKEFLGCHHPVPSFAALRRRARSEEHTSELQSLMRISYAVFCLKKKNIRTVRNQ